MDSQQLHRCDYVPGNWHPTARGFRCCLDPIDIPDAAPDADAALDADAAPDVTADGDAQLDAPLDLDAPSSETETGCIVEGDAGDAQAPGDSSIDVAVEGPDDVDAAEDASISLEAAADVSEDASAEQTADVLEDLSVDAVEDFSIGQDAEEEQAQESGSDADLDVQQEDGLADSAEEQEAAAGSCPADMVLLDDFCIDKYEASHDDATSDAPGSSPLAASRAGVVPWNPVDLSTARQACLAAGKRLCRPEEWQGACQGPSLRVYSYGNAYAPATCNGIDTFCYCGSASCQALSVCPYPHCYNLASGEGGGPCGSFFHLMVTGAFPDCGDGSGVYDLNGNVWEIVDTQDGFEHFRGGAYNCGDSEVLHRCDYDATWGPSARGFRCCKDVATDAEP